MALHFGAVRAVVGDRRDEIEGPYSIAVIEGTAQDGEYSLQNRRAAKLVYDSPIDDDENIVQLTTRVKHPVYDKDRPTEVTERQMSEISSSK